MRAISIFFRVSRHSGVVPQLVGQLPGGDICMIPDKLPTVAEIEEQLAGKL